MDQETTWILWLPILKMVIMPKIFYQEAIKSLLSFFKGRNGKNGIKTPSIMPKKCICIQGALRMSEEINAQLDLNEHSEKQLKLETA